jgi:hypothetical protein
MKGRSDVNGMGFKLLSYLLSFFMPEPIVLDDFKSLRF